MASTDDILKLVRQALDEFDERPLDVAVRRAVRIASLVGDSRTAVRFGLELKALGGDKQANGADTRALMADPSLWGTGTGPAEEAMTEYLNDRKLNRDDPTSKVFTHSITELEFLMTQTPSTPDGRVSAQSAEFDYKAREILTRTRHRVFVKLCGWERQYTYASINQTIFENFQRDVDQMLATGAPDLVDQFSAVYRRLREAADRDPERPATEELSQAITSCRRILKAVVDRVLPPQDQKSADGHKLGDAQHRNRLFEFIKQSIDSSSEREVIGGLTTGLYERFAAVDTLSNKGVHAAMALETANLCALNTYILGGEVLRIEALVRGSESQQANY